MRCHSPGRFARRALILLLLLPLFTASCRSGPTAGVEITRMEYGEQWPFTVDRGELACVGSSGVVFTAEGTTYGVNEAAVASGYPDVEPIRQGSPILPSLKVSIAPVIEDGLALCR